MLPRSGGASPAPTIRTLRRRVARPHCEFHRTATEGRLPAAGGEQIFLFHLADVEAGHGFAEFFGGFENGFRILVVRCGFHDGFGAGFGIAGLEDARADEYGFGAELHHERGVGGSGDAAC